MRGLKNRGKLLKKPKNLLNSELTIGLPHKQPEEQEIAQDDTAAVLHLCLACYRCFTE